VQRVHRRGKAWLADVEVADTLQTRSIDLGRGTWQRVEG
jgi:hypothetical protein